MSSFAVGSDPWIITAEDRTKYDSQFLQLHPVAGFLTGEQARNFFVQSGLPLPVLSQIWMLSDMNADGKMDRREFAIAMHLIKRKLQGYELPAAPPFSLVQSLDSIVSVPLAGNSAVGPRLASPYGSQTLPHNYLATGVPVMGGPLMGQSVSAVGGFPAGPGGFSAAPPVVSAMPPTSFSSPNKMPSSSASAEWTIPQQQRLKYKQVFNSHDPTHKGFLTGMEAKAILSQFGLVHSTLAQIWCLADIDVDGNLSPDEFCVAMYLIDLAKMGQIIPAVLPPGLVPPAYRKFRRPSETGAGIASPVSVTGTLSKPQDSFNDLLGGIGFGGASSVNSASAVDADGKATDVEGGKLGIITFEDKRKENFDKGQAELERRRAMLRDMQQKEAEARLAAEKAEQEKRERLRLEMEMKKQHELEKQLEKQRQIEMEREEQRRKAMEQREAARRELEHQRQLEWERQRRDQLMAEMQREHSHVDRLRLELGQDKLELDSISTKLEDVKSKLEQGRHSFTEFTQAIDTMRTSRDAKICDIEKLQAEVEDWNRKLSLTQQERLKLSHQSHGQSPMIDDEVRRLSQNCRTKRENVERLKNEMITVEERTSSIQQKIDACVNELNELNKVMVSVQTVNTQTKNGAFSMKKELDCNGDRSQKPSFALADGFSVGQTQNSAMNATDSKSNADAFGDINWEEVSKAFPKDPEDAWSQSTSQTNGVDVWGESFATVPATNGFADKWPSSSKSSVPSSTYQKHIALYDFVARNFDELSFKVGDEVLVKDDSDPTAEWIVGKAGNKEGLFPRAFVQLAQTDDLTVTSETTELKLSDISFGMDSVFSATAKRSHDAETDVAFAHNQSITASADSSFNVVPPSAPSPTPGQKSQSAPEGMQVQAIYPWLAKKDNHLTFAKGDTIIVKEQQDMWWSGELNGKVGWFPKSYVKPVIDSTPSNNVYDTVGKTEQSGWTASFEAVSEPPTISHSSSPSLLPSMVSATADTAVNNGTELCVALYSYTSNIAGDLTFNQGDVISLVQADGDWWTGTKDSTTGIFPANYVKKMETSTKKKSRAPVAPSALPHSASEKNVLLNQNSSRLAAAGKKPEIATVLAPYQATGPEQLSLLPGQLIDVRKKNPSGWWEGELQARGQKRRIGWFPANYVKLLGQGGSAATTPDHSSSIPSRPHSADPTSERLSPVSLPAPTAAPSVEQVVAMFAYQKQNPDELDFNKGSIINVINKLDADWWMGELNGITGLFPSNYVSPLTASTSNTE